MTPIKTILTWLAGMRANFLVLAVVLVMVGGGAARYTGTFHTGLFLMTVLGVVCAHISVNLFNEYYDWKTGIDARTERTPFSGGSGSLQKGLLRPAQVRAAAWLALTVAGCIGLLLARISGWPVLVLMVVGGFTIVFYTGFLARIMLGELASGITLGSLVVIGTYYVQTGAINSMVIWASIPPGILTLLLLFLNEFPDVEADRVGGRRHMVIALGKHNAAYVYAGLLMTVYFIIIGGVVLGDMPLSSLIGLATFPLSVIVSFRTIRHFHNIQELIPALGMNVIIVLATDFLLALGFVL